MFYKALPHQNEYAILVDDKNKLVDLSSQSAFKKKRGKLPKGLRHTGWLVLRQRVADTTRIMKVPSLTYL